MDSEGLIRIKEEGTFLTRRKIMLTFIYGKLAHADEEKEALYEKWMQMPVIPQFCQFEFNGILATVLQVIAYVKWVNVKALKEVNEN